eukprot:5603414-Pyramimonas_sp.AAC.1
MFESAARNLWTLTCMKSGAGHPLDININTNCINYWWNCFAGGVLLINWLAGQGSVATGAAARARRGHRRIDRLRPY